MGTWNYRKSLLVLGSLGILMIVFGQNFEFIIPNTLLRPPSNEESLWHYIREPQSIKKSVVDKYLLSHPPLLGPQDMTYEGAGKKVLNQSIDNFTQDEEFRNSELGRSYAAIEKKAHIDVKIKAPNIDMLGITDDDIELSADQNSAYVKVSSTKMTYSMQSQNMDLLYQKQKTNHSIGVGYDPKSEASTVKMQLSW
jgi:hypothetical protein